MGNTKILRGLPERIMTDKIIIKGLKTKCVIGDYDWERKRAQKIILDLEMEADLKEATENDALNPNIPDYNQIAKDVLNFVEKSAYRLVETLAEEVAQLILKKFPVESVLVRLTKPAAIKAAEGAGVEIVRTR